MAINHPSYKIQSEPVSEVIARAIERSKSHNEIVTIENQDGLCDDLFAECEGDADGDGVREFWGVDCDGNEWRVHVTVD